MPRVTRLPRARVRARALPAAAARLAVRLGRRRACCATRGTAAAGAARLRCRARAALGITARKVQLPAVVCRAHRGTSVRARLRRPCHAPREASGVLRGPATSPRAARAATASLRLTRRRHARAPARARQGTTAPPGAPRAQELRAPLAASVVAVRRSRRRAAPLGFSAPPARPTPRARGARPGFLAAQPHTPLPRAPGRASVPAAPIAPLGVPPRAPRHASSADRAATAPAGVQHR